MIEACLNRVVSAIVETAFGGDDGDRALACNESSHFDGFFQALLGLSKLAGKSLFESFLWCEEACSVGKFTSPAVVPYDFLETLKSTNVCCKPNIDFFDRHPGVFGHNPDVGGRS